MAIHLTFLRDRCKGCGLCIALCPKHILALDTSANVKGYRPAISRVIPSSRLKFRDLQEVQSNCARL